MHESLSQVYVSDLCTQIIKTIYPAPAGLKLYLKMCLLQESHSKGFSCLCSNTQSWNFIFKFIFFLKKVFFLFIFIFYLFKCCVLSLKRFLCSHIWGRKGRQFVGPFSHALQWCSISQWNHNISQNNKINKQPKLWDFFLQLGWCKRQKNISKLGEKKWLKKEEGGHNN